MRSFQPGIVKWIIFEEKRYYPFVEVFRNRRYSRRLFFRTATKAWAYARRWAKRAGSFVCEAGKG